jgi:hypothetical protein
MVWSSWDFSVSGVVSANVENASWLREWCVEKWVAYWLVEFLE